MGMNSTEKKDAKPQATARREKYLAHPHSTKFHVQLKGSQTDRPTMRQS